MGHTALKSVRRSGIKRHAMGIGAAGTVLGSAWKQILSDVMWELLIRTGHIAVYPWVSVLCSRSRHRTELRAYHGGRRTENLPSSSHIPLFSSYSLSISLTLSPLATYSVSPMFPFKMLSFWPLFFSHSSLFLDCSVWNCSLLQPSYKFLFSLGNAIGVKM